MSKEVIKKAVGRAAAEFIKDGMHVGLGTGSTTFYFIERMIERVREGLKIRAAASSLRSLKQVQEGGIPLLDINEISSLDITVDGADEIDPQKRMIKGGGGALVREKIIASMSKELMIIVDESKLVSKLGKSKLPVEVIPFAIQATLHKMQKLGYQGSFRLNQNKSLFVTDNGNYIIDIHFRHLCEQPELDHEALIHLPGIVDTGFFFNLAGKVVVGFADGQIAVRP